MQQYVEETYGHAYDRIAPLQTSANCFRAESRADRRAVYIKTFDFS